MKKAIAFTRTMRWVRWVPACFCLLLLTGCVGNGGRVQEARTLRPSKEATREQLLADLERNMSGLLTLKAKAMIMMIRQDLTVPATIRDDVWRIRGKPYRKEFLRAQVNGLLLLARDPITGRNIRFSGDVVGLPHEFRLLGKGSDFWFSLPNEERDRDDEEAPPGFVYKGKTNRKHVRTEEFWSIRPQDICDLLLHDEVFDPKLICSMETWDEYYILVFFRQDWPQHISSKIWIERKNLKVEIHQIFDGSGRLIAEGRFGDYESFLAKKTRHTISLPTKISFLWPRDNLLMKIQIEGGKVNEEIGKTGFQEYIPPGYEEVEVPE